MRFLFLFLGGKRNRKAGRRLLELGTWKGCYEIASSLYGDYCVRNGVVVFLDRGLGLAYCDSRSGNK